MSSQELPAFLFYRFGALLQRFGDAWRSGQQPRIEDYLGEIPEPYRRHLLPHLLGLELDHLDQNGASPE